MERSKIKTFVIALLLVVNVFFLALVISKEMSSAALREQMKADVVRIMSDNGITVSAEIIPENTKQYSYKILRDTEAEKTLAQSILGYTNYEDQGGNIYYYEGNSGNAQFRSGGSFEITFTGNAYSSRDYAALSLSLARTMGVDVDKDSAVIKEGEVGQTVSLTGKWDNVPVFNCLVSFKFEDGSLSQISGRRLMGTPQASGDDELITAATALMNFLNAIKREGYICNEILSVSQGYVLGLSVSGDGSLTPVWQILTDTGVFYINAVTGNSETDVIL